MIETIYDHTVHPRYLGAQSHVLDLGANYGLFAKAITARFGCRCLAVEPSPEPFAAIAETPLISKLQAAAAAKSGMVPFHIATDSIHSSMYRPSAVVNVIDVRALSLPDLFALVGVTPLDLVKIDIEGAEIDMINSCPPSILQQIRQLSVEFHDHNGITPASEIRSTLARLHKLGFFSVRMSRQGHHDTWLINRNLCDVSTAELKFIERVAPTWIGIKRVARRKFARFATKRTH
jgi:FkbM family methyltransferase